MYLKLNQYDKAIQDCSTAISQQKNYWKAYHRRGKAYFALKQFGKAYLDFKEILDHDPSNAEVNGELRECQRNLSEQEINSLTNNQYIT